MSLTSLPMQVRALASTNLVDPDKRTVEVVFATETPVRRRRYEGWDRVVDFEEILTISKSAIDFTRLNAGAPVLDSHMRYSTAAQVGVVDKAWIDGHEARALVRFAGAGVDEAADRLFALIAEGIVRNTSVGYTLQKIRIIEPEKRGDLQKVIAQRWTPSEISFVTVPADPRSGVRAEDGKQLFDVELEDSSAAAAVARMRMRQAQQQLA
ncbi:hypothetical protein [Devosia ginsengisoli]|uniref:hypothetical protein n=1 Tax=Devosia ginsengisoli TaxID=400770 RepID=UPI0026E9DABE|nr:hypothetical protein [Devosia ginsengisoli]MCR6672193.1 hypothetical protein [Devosia ginsengisoli]